MQEYLFISKNGQQMASAAGGSPIPEYSVNSPSLYSLLSSSAPTRHRLLLSFFPLPLVLRPKQLRDLPNSLPSALTGQPLFPSLLLVCFLHYRLTNVKKKPQFLFFIFPWRLVAENGPPFPFLRVGPRPVFLLRFSSSVNLPSSPERTMGVYSVSCRKAGIVCCRFLAVPRLESFCVCT